MTGRFDGTGAGEAAPREWAAPNGWDRTGGRGPLPGWAGPGATRTPSGLFPSKPPRPTWREPHPIRSSMVLAGAGAGTVWMLLFGVLASTARGYVWWTIAAALAAWVVALGLVRFGDRGVAAGVGLAGGAGLAVAGVVVTVSWAYGNWLLW